MCSASYVKEQHQNQSTFLSLKIQSFLKLNSNLPLKLDS